jgi:hypothetical protein
MAASWYFAELRRRETKMVEEHGGRKLVMAERFDREDMIPAASDKVLYQVVQLCRSTAYGYGLSIDKSGWIVLDEVLDFLDSNRSHTARKLALIKAMRERGHFNIQFWKSNKIQDDVTPEARGVKRTNPFAEVVSEPSTGVQSHGKGSSSVRASLEA